MPEVIIPFAGDCPHRARALEWVRDRYEWPVTVAAGGEPWVKAEAIRPAIEASSADVLVIADADCWTDGLTEAVRAVELGAPWAKPHRLVHRLTAESSLAFMAGKPWSELAEPAYQGVAGGGFIVARRETLLDVPMDPRFVGWGQEDIAYAIALHTLAGPAWLGDADLFHLWHPPQERLSRMWGSVSNKRLLRRYSAAKCKPDVMRSLIEEIHVAHRPDESSLLDCEPHV